MIFKLSKHGDNEEVAQLLRWKMLAVEDLVHMHSHNFIGRIKVSFYTLYIGRYAYIDLNFVRKTKPKAFLLIS